MSEFILKEILSDDIEFEVKNIGFDKSYVHRAVEKFRYKNIKIYDVTPAQANIIKQTALTVGADCATHREVITGKIEKSDCIIGGSFSQIRKIAQKLQAQPFGLRYLGDKLTQFIDTKASKRTKIVGILNLTPDSFSDGGLYNDVESAKKHLLEMIDDGADIIDIGAESTRPYSVPVADYIQLEKLLPIIRFAKDKIEISVDTRSSFVAEECIKAGARIINDVSGFDYDSKMVDIIAKYGVKVVIQHSKGSPENMQDNPLYDNLLDEIYFSLMNKIQKTVSIGIKKENIIIDVGIGFGKTREDNFKLLKHIQEFYSLGCPCMLGISRKSFLGIEEKDNALKDIYTIALNALAIEHGVEYLRVHNVKLHSGLLHIMDNI